MDNIFLICTPTLVQPRIETFIEFSAYLLSIRSHVHPSGLSKSTPPTQDVMSVENEVLVGVY